ncbi:hypothetical protein OAP63_17125, partial [Vibrio sp.]|nr:hypothetical protein [Vibrio sp.]
MSYRRVITSTALQFPLSLLVKSKIIPYDYQIDINRPIIYAMPFFSDFDLTTLKKKVIELGMPDPTLPLFINGSEYPR